MKYDTRRVIKDELWRGVAWLALSLVGWSIIYTETNVAVIQGPVWALLVVGTVLGLIGLMVGIRLWTGLELKADTESSQVLQYVFGSVVAGFVLLYLVLARGYPAWWFPAFVVAEVVGFALLRRSYWSVAET